MNEARGYLQVLHNRNFLVLWLAQIFSLISLNSTMFVAIILVEKVTGSSTQTAAVISAFSLPAVFLAAVAGIVVDRVSKKRILVVSNALRLLFQLLLALLAALALAKSPLTGVYLFLIYVDIFIASAVGQFFAPAEGSTIPLVVGRSGLLAANSLFTLTVIGTQVAALIVLVPVAIKLLGIVNALLLLAVFYVGATVLVMLLPRDPVPRGNLGVESIYRSALKEIAEGWEFSLKHHEVLYGILQLGLVAFLVFSVSALLPGYAARVLGLAPEDAIFVFSPAGAGIVLASLLVVRFGDRFERFTLPAVGTVLMAFSFLSFGVISRLADGQGAPIALVRPEWLFSATGLVGVCSAVAGVALALILIPAQTAVQEGAPDEIRGRVLTVQFTLYNALGIPPLLTISGLADVFGIPDMTLALGVLLLLIAALDVYYARRLVHRARRRPAVQPLPLPGTDVMTVRSGDNGLSEPADPEPAPSPEHQIRS